MCVAFNPSFALFSWARGMLSTAEILAVTLSSSAGLRQVGHDWISGSGFAGGAGQKYLLWLAAVREPRSWFYSAVEQACYGNRAHAACRANTSVAELEALGWWRQPVPPWQWNWRQTPRPKAALPEYYFYQPDLQSAMLGNLTAAEPHTMLCALESLDVAVAAARWALHRQDRQRSGD